MPSGATGPTDRRGDRSGWSSTATTATASSTPPTIPFGAIAGERASVAAADGQGVVVAAGLGYRNPTPDGVVTLPRVSIPEAGYLVVQRSSEGERSTDEPPVAVTGLRAGTYTDLRVDLGREFLARQSTRFELQATLYVDDGDDPLAVAEPVGSTFAVQRPEGVETVTATPTRTDTATPTATDTATSTDPTRTTPDGDPAETDTTTASPTASPTATATTPPATVPDRTPPPTETTATTAETDGGPGSGFGVVAAVVAVAGAAAVALRRRGR